MKQGWRDWPARRAPDAVRRQMLRHQLAVWDDMSQLGEQAVKSQDRRVGRHENLFR